MQDATGRSIAGAIVLLAGAVLIGTSLIADIIARNGHAANQFGGIVTAWGVVMAIVGLVLFGRAWVERAPPKTPDDGQPR